MIEQKTRLFNTIDKYIPLINNMYIETMDKFLESYKNNRKDIVISITKIIMFIIYILDNIVILFICFVILDFIIVNVTKFIKDKFHNKWRL